jgi:DNA-binding NarL/FixJ family response regulator
VSLILIISSLNAKRCPQKKMKILIVDDHKGMRELMRSFLPDVFDEIHECEDGSDAVDCYREQLPDWVLMDWKMKRMDGITATRQIIAAYPQARILLVTNFDDDNLRRAGREAGAFGYIVKENLRSISEILPQA